MNAPVVVLCMSHCFEWSWRKSPPHIHKREAGAVWKRWKTTFYLRWKIFWDLNQKARPSQYYTNSYALPSTYDSTSTNSSFYFPMPQIRFQSVFLRFPYKIQNGSNRENATAWRGSLEFCAVGCCGRFWREALVMIGWWMVAVINSWVVSSVVIRADASTT